MFFGEDKIRHMRAMILADNEKDRRTALKKLLPLQRKDFAGVFKAMDGLPVTIRTLDPPLHEFLPRRERLDGGNCHTPYADAKEKKALVARYSDYGAKGVGDLKKLLSTLLARLNSCMSSIPCSDIVDVGLASPIRKLRRCRRGRSLKRRSMSRRGCEGASRSHDSAGGHGEEMANQAASCGGCGQVFKKGTKSSTWSAAMIAWFAISFTVATSGIMTSGSTFTPFFATSTAASKIARACISVISG